MACYTLPAVVVKQYSGECHAGLYKVEGAAALIAYAGGQKLVLQDQYARSYSAASLIAVVDDTGVFVPVRSAPAGSDAERPLVVALYGILFDTATGFSIDVLVPPEDYYEWPTRRVRVYYKTSKGDVVFEGEVPVAPTIKVAKDATNDTGDTVYMVCGNDVVAVKPGEKYPCTPYYVYCCGRMWLDSKDFIFADSSGGAAADKPGCEVENVYDPYSCWQSV